VSWRDRVDPAPAEGFPPEHGLCAAVPLEETPLDSPAYVPSLSDSDTAPADLQQPAPDSEPETTAAAGSGPRPHEQPVFADYAFDPGVAPDNDQAPAPPAPDTLEATQAPSPAVADEAVLAARTEAAPAPADAANSAALSFYE